MRQDRLSHYEGVGGIPLRCVNRVDAEGNQLYTSIDNFLRKMGVSSADAIAFSSEDPKLATAVLLYRVIQVDGRVRDSEMRRYREILQDYLKISPDGLALFESMVESESNSNSSMVSITSIVEKMPERTKREILKLMQDISVSDNELHEFELNLVARTAELLHISIKE